MFQLEAREQNPKKLEYLVVNNGFCERDAVVSVLQHASTLPLTDCSKISVNHSISQQLTTRQQHIPS